MASTMNKVLGVWIYYPGFWMCVLSVWRWVIVPAAVFMHENLWVVLSFWTCSLLTRSAKRSGLQAGFLGLNFGC